MNEYRVIFDNTEILVCGRDREEAQENAIEQMEDMGEQHGAILAIKLNHRNV